MKGRERPLWDFKSPSTTLRAVPLPTGGEEKCCQISPASGDEGSAYIRFGIRPAR